MADILCTRCESANFRTGVRKLPNITVVLFLCLNNENIQFSHHRSLKFLSLPQASNLSILSSPKPQIQVSRIFHPGISHNSYQFYPHQNLKFINSLLTFSPQICLKFTNSLLTQSSNLSILSSHKPKIYQFSCQPRLKFNTSYKKNCSVSHKIIFEK